MKKIGVIGLGHRIGQVISENITDAAKIVAVTDINPDKVKAAIDLCPQMYDSNLRVYDDADKMLAEEQLDGIFIGTRCDLHTYFAVKVMEKGIPLLLEKPVSTNMDDLKKLKDAMVMYNPKVMTSFPFRYNKLINLAKEIIDSGKIGTVEQVQAFNDVPYGRIYFHDWYRDDVLTGGLWLQKATHDLDCIDYILGMRPIEICAMESKQIFKGDMPEGLKCADCNKYNTCPESPKIITKVYNDRLLGDYCCFAKDTGNHDSATAILRYENGMHAAYSQNFFARKKAARRGGRYYGYKGTLEYDCETAEVKVYMHNTDRVDTYKLELSGTHFGSDAILFDSFLELMDGKGESTLDAGISSALICMKAKESCEKSCFVKIPDIYDI